MTPKLRRFLDEARPATPCLVLDVDVVERNYLALALPDVAIFYAVKARRRRKARPNGAAEPPGKARKGRKRREGWNGSVYRRPRDGIAAPAEAEDGPFIEGPLDDLGRG